MSHFYTTENCIGCNKCIKACSYIGACKRIIEDGKDRVRVNPDAKYKVVQGEKNLYEYLKNNEEDILNNKYNYVLYDFANCKLQCVYGTGSYKKQVPYEMVERGYKDVSSKMAKEAMEKMFKDPRNIVKMMKPKALAANIAEMNAAFDRTIDCTGCGFENCATMVKAIYNGLAPKESCMYYVKSVNEKTGTLAATTQTISASTQNIAAVSEKVKQELNSLKNNSVRD